MRMSGHIFCRALLGWLLLSGATAATATPLTFGSVSNEPGREIRLYAPLVRYLAQKLAPDGITKGQILVAASMKEMAELLRSGRVDFYADSPMPSIVVNQLAGSKMFLRRWKKGVAEYRSVVFVRKESPIQELSHLVGQLVGFERPYSSSGYIVPSIAMRQAGLELEQLADFQAKVPAGRVGYIFNDDDENTLIRVLRGRLAAGVMAEESLPKQAKGDLEKLRILHHTFVIPRHIINLRGDYPDHLERALLRAFVDMEQDPEGQVVLKKFEKTLRFDPIPLEVREQLQKITPVVLEMLEQHAAQQDG